MTLADAFPLEPGDVLVMPEWYAVPDDPEERVRVLLVLLDDLEALEEAR